jgi:serine/threonine-protein kinase
MVRDADVKTAARKLGVENIISGSVRRSSQMIRVNAQLVDGDDGLERWSETFDRPAGDLLEIQTSIAENVVQALSVQLAGENRKALTLGGTDNPAAQDLYLRSDPARPVDTREALEESVAFLNAAIALDPGFAQAYARKGFLLTFLAGIYALSRQEAQDYYRQATAAAERAIAIEPRLARAYAVRAAVYRDHLEMGKAFADFDRADALPGEDAIVLRAYGVLLAQARRFEEGRRKMERARALDPLNPVSFEADALFFALAREYPVAIADARRSLQLQPKRLQSRRILANALLQQGSNAEAKSEYEKLDANDYRRLLGEAILAVRNGDRTAAMSKLNVMEQRYGDAALYQYAQIYAQLGMADEAIAALDRAYAVRDPGMPFIQVDAFLDPLRHDPRFTAIESRLNFPKS